MAFEATPWVSYQGNFYMGQGGERCVVTIKIESVGKWDWIVKVAKEEKLDYRDFEEPKLLNAIEAHHNH